MAISPISSREVCSGCCSPKRSRRIIPWCTLTRLNTPSGRAVLSARSGEISFEPRRKRDAAAVERRNQELADAAYRLVRASRSRSLPIWELVILLLGRGHFLSDVAPDPVEKILNADGRFREAGLDF